MKVTCIPTASFSLSAAPGGGGGGAGVSLTRGTIRATAFT